MLCDSENGQGHAMLGSNYWQEQDAKVIAHEDAAHEIEERGPDILARSFAIVTRAWARVSPNRISPLRTATSLNLG